MKTTKSIKKVKIKANRVVIDFVLHTETDDSRILNTYHTVDSEVRPHDDFVKAFQNLNIHGIRVCELTVFMEKIDQKILDKHKVTTLTFAESDEATQVVISLNKEIANGKLFSVSTPLINLYEDEYYDQEKIAEDVDKVIVEATKFIDGKNGEKQLEIKFAA